VEQLLKLIDKKGEVKLILNDDGTIQEKKAKTFSEENGKDKEDSKEN
jgi:hypothetical protein